MMKPYEANRVVAALDDRIRQLEAELAELKGRLAGKAIETGALRAECERLQEALHQKTLAARGHLKESRELQARYDRLRRAVEEAPCPFDTMPCEKRQFGVCPSNCWKRIALEDGK